MILDMLNESNLFGTSVHTENNQEENFLEGVEAIALRENEDPVSACYRITMENEQNWFNIMNTIAYSEMAFLESHGPEEVMYEAADIKKIKDTIVTWIQQQWAKLKGVMEKAISNLSEAIHKDKAVVSAYESKVKKDPKVAKETKKVQKPRLTVSVDDLDTFIKDIVDKAHSQFDDLWSFTNYADNATCQERITAFAKKDFELGAKAKELKEGFSTKESVVISAETAYKVVKAGNHANTLKRVLKAEQDGFNKMLATFKKEKQSEKGSKLYANASQIVTLKSKYVKQVISQLNMGAKICIQAANNDYVTHRAVLRALVGTKTVGESATVEKPANESADLICALI